MWQIETRVRLIQTVAEGPALKPTLIRIIDLSESQARDLLGFLHSQGPVIVGQLLKWVGGDVTVELSAFDANDLRRLLKLYFEECLPPVSVKYFR